MQVTMSQTLYAYVDGADLEGVAQAIEHRLSTFIASRTWFSRPDLVNQRHDPDPRDNTDDLPLWDLGVNVAMPQEPFPGDWFRDVEALIRELAELRSQVGRDFVVGIHESESGIAEDLFFVDSDTHSMQTLREIIGVP
jgi:hypothetical protein